MSEGMEVWGTRSTCSLGDGDERSQFHSRFFVTDLGIRLGNLIRRCERIGENLKLAYLVSWLKWSKDSQGTAARLGHRVKAMSRQEKFGEKLYISPTRDGEQ